MVAEGETPLKWMVGSEEWVVAISPLRPEVCFGPSEDCLDLLEEISLSVDHFVVLDHSFRCDT